MSISRYRLTTRDEHITSQPKGTDKGHTNTYIHTRWYIQCMYACMYSTAHQRIQLPVAQCTLSTVTNNLVTFLSVRRTRTGKGCSHTVFTGISFNYCFCHSQKIRDIIEHKFDHHNHIQINRYQIVWILSRIICVTK